MTAPDERRPPLAQGDPRLLETDTARRLLAARIPARMAYIALDGSPRIVPTWIHWTGVEAVMATYIAGPGIRRPARRLRALRANPAVAVCVDTEGQPPAALTLRGDVTVTEHDGPVPEYALSARRYLGEEAADELLRSIAGPGTRMARIALRPVWVGLIDFQTRLPDAMGGVHDAPGDVA